MTHYDNNNEFLAQLAAAEPGGGLLSPISSSRLHTAMSIAENTLQFIENNNKPKQPQIKIPRLDFSKLKPEFLEECF